MQNLPFMIKKFGIFGGPAYLHDTTCNKEHLVIPDIGHVKLIIFSS